MTSEINQSLKTALAGATSGAVTRFICQPFDVIKIRFQVQTEPLSIHNQASKYKTINQAIQLIYREEGLLAFWKGHNPAQILSILYGLTQFTVYEELNKNFQKLNYFRDKNAARNFISGGIAGATATAVSTPLDVIRTRLIVQDKSKGYRNSYQALILIVRHEGPKGLYRGFWPSILQITPLVGAHFMLYKFFCNLLQTSLDLKSQSELPTWGLFTMGALSGICSKIITYPLDLIKKRLQIQGFDSSHQTFGQHFQCQGLVSCATSTFKTEGFIGLYKGISPSLIKAGVVTALNFCVYDEVKKMLK